MDYQQALRFLFESLPMYQRIGGAAYKANLDNTLALDHYFGHPHRRFRSIHVAGTNGKGSVSHLLSSVLAESGRRTGLYTSPHLLDFRERIRVNGSCIPKKEVLNFVNGHQGIIREVSPSFFEMTVAMAFDHFAKKQVDAAVVEVGMGGRLDSTNILTPVLSVITNISMDHMAFLGNDIPSIAAEKGGIIKEGVPVVLGPMAPEAEKVLLKIAEERHAPVTLARDFFRTEYRTFSPEGYSLFTCHDLHSGKRVVYPCGLNGNYQGENLSTVLTALQVLQASGWTIREPAIRKGIGSVIENTGIMGRWQTLGSNPRSVCDIAHNPAGIASVMEQVGQTPWKNLHIVWGMVSDKNRETIFPLLPAEASYYFTPSSVPRSLDAAQLADEAASHGFEGQAYPSVKAAYEAAVTAAGREDMIFTGGSTFVVADLLAALGY